MSPKVIQIITTTAEKDDADRIAAMLVEKRLAACTQVSGPMESRYWWNDRIEMVREWQIVIKTRGDLYKEVEAAILEDHPYDEPEILSVNVANVSAGYRKWLLAQLKIPPKQSVEPVVAPVTEGPVAASNPSPLDEPKPEAVTNSRKKRAKTAETDV